MKRAMFEQSAARTGVRGVLRVLAVMLALVPAAVIAQQKPVKIGLLVPLTGVFSFEGIAAARGFELFLEQNGGKLGGLPVTIQKEDEQGKADIGLTKTRQLVEQAKVDLIVGPVSSPVALAIKDYVTQQKMPVIVLNALTDSLTKKDGASPYVFRVMTTASQANRPFGEWVAQKMKFKKMVLVGMDFAAGRDSVNAFKAGFTAKGGEVVGEIFTPINTSDYSPFIGRIRLGETDATYAWVAGSDAVRFVKQWQETGLKSRMPLVGFAGLTEDMILPELKDAAAGLVVVTPYTTSISTETNRKFTQAFRERYKSDASLPASNGYIAAQVLNSAIAAVGGVDNKQALLAALAKVSVDTLRGRVSFDENRQVICDLFVVKAEPVGDHFENRIIDTIAQVRQPQ